MNLAVHALRMKYLKDPLREQERKDLREYCLKNMSSQNIAKFLLKLQREDLNQIIVQFVLENQTTEKKNFIQYKYRDKMTFVKMSLLLNVTANQLHCWHKEILKEIEDIMFYKLSVKNIFSMTKLLNMIYILDKQIEFLEESYTELLDEGVLEILIKKRNQFQTAYTTLQEHIEHPERNIKNRIVQAKTQNISASIEELADRCETSKASVSTYLQEYIRQNRVLDV